MSIEDKKYREHNINKTKSLINVLYIKTKLDNGSTIQDIKDEYYKELDNFKLSPKKKRALYISNIYRYWYTHFKNKGKNASKQSSLFNL